MRWASPIDSIASAFSLRSPTVYTHFHKTRKAIHKVFVERYIKSQWESPLRAPVKYSEYGLIANATVQKRGGPASSFEETKRFFSGEHWIYYRKSQVVTNRGEMAMYVTAGIPGSVHDFSLFRDSQNQLTKLVTLKPGEPTKLHGDKGYIGFREDSPLQFVMPHKKPARWTLRPRETHENYDLASARVVAENFRG
jgi:hypothetical protein